MNKNKGFIGLGLIVAIVLGIIVVGGGAYYFGKGSSKQEVKNPENILPNNQDQNLQPVNQNQPVDNSVKAVTLDMSSELARTYTTAFTNALKQPANFNGHYSIASWGCGSGCLNYGIVDKLTGKVYQAPGDDYGNTAGYSGDADFNKTRWSLNSNIFKVIGYTSIDSFKFENEKFTKIGSIPFPVSTTNWKTYGNYGLSFKYPDTWSKYGEDSKIVDLSGNVVAYEINFKDTISNTTLLISYHLPPNGSKVYDYAVSEFNSKHGWYETGSKEIDVAGSKAIEAFTTMNVDGRGNKINPPLRLIIVDFLDIQKTGAIQLQFKTPVPNEEIEVAKFNKFLSTFQLLLPL